MGKKRIIPLEGKPRYRALALVAVCSPVVETGKHGPEGVDQFFSHMNVMDWKHVETHSYLIQQCIGYYATGSQKGDPVWVEVPEWTQPTLEKE